MTKVPNYVHSGPKAMLINHYSASGGDAFPYFFKELNIGPLIGTRTWGGLVGIGGNPVFIDGGSIDVPQSGIVGTNGEWVVEGVGVSPDIEVWDSPDQVVKGHDPSLEKAVEVLMKELAAKPAMKPVKPADPDRSKWREKK
jgi:tricorn protease